MCTSLSMILKKKSPFIIQSITEMEIKKVGLIHAYFIYSFYNIENDEKIHLKNGETLKVKRGCYTMKDIEKVSSVTKLIDRSNNGNCDLAKSRNCNETEEPSENLTRKEIG